MARETSVVARCAVFCNAFAPLFDERVKKVRCKKVEARGVLFFATVLRHLWSTRKRASARCTVFYNGFCTPRAPKVDAVLFFATVLNRLPLPPARLASDLRPTCVRLVSGLCPTCVRLCVAGKLCTRVAGVRFVSKTRVLYESGNVF